MDDTARIQAIVQKMVDDGQPSDVIEEFVKRAREARVPGPVSKPAPTDAGPWAQGYVGAEDYGPPAKTYGQRVADVLGQGLGAAESAAAGLNRGALLGLPAKLLDLTGLRSEADSQADMAANPTAAALGKGTGMGLDMVMPGGAGNMLTRSAGAAVESAAPRLAQSVVGRIASGGLQGVGVGGAYGAAEAATNGEPIVPALERGAALGGAAGTGGAAAGEAMTGLSKLLRLDPWIRRYAEAQMGGAYKDPAMQALPGGKEGIQEASRQGLGRIMTQDAKRLTEAGGEWQKTMDAEGQRPLDGRALTDQLEQGRRANVDPDSQLPIRDSVERAYQTAIRRTPEQPTVQGSVMRRQGLRADAAFDSPSPTPEQDAARAVYSALRQGVRNASPAMASADDAYAAEAARAARTHDILANTEENVITGGPGHIGGEARPMESPAELGVEPGRMRVGKERQAITTLRRVGDTNEPGLRAKQFLDELYHQDPEFAKAIDFILAKKAKEATSLGLPMQSLDIHGVAGAGGMLGLASQNARFLGARLADPALNFGAGASTQATRLIPGLEMFLPPYPFTQENDR